MTCLGFFSNVIQGALVGAALALLLPLSGAGKRKEPFGNLLWLPALLLVLSGVRIRGCFPGLAGTFAFPADYAQWSSDLD